MLQHSEQLLRRPDAVNDHRLMPLRRQSEELFEIVLLHRERRAAQPGEPDLPECGGVVQRLPERRRERLEPFRQLPRVQFKRSERVARQFFLPAGDERPRRRRPDGDRRRQENPNSQLPQEEMNFTLGDFLKNREKEDA